MLFVVVQVQFELIIQGQFELVIQGQLELLIQIQFGLCLAHDNHYIVGNFINYCFAVMINSNTYMYGYFICKLPAIPSLLAQRDTLSMAASHLFVCIILCTYYSVAHGGDEHGGFATVLTTSRYFQPEAAVCSTSRGTQLVWFGLVSAH